MSVATAFPRAESEEDCCLSCTCPSPHPYRSSHGEYRWRLRATNGQVIATGGEGYSSKAAAQSGIESVKREPNLP
ncbi:MAG TPA: YegP family protein [Propionibacteriaceae bacterium]